MNWETEWWVKLYCADTPSWLMWPWQSRALFPLLLRKSNRAGIVELGKHGVHGLAVLVGLPDEVVREGLDGLIADGCVTLDSESHSLLVVNFEKAQSRSMSNRERQALYRERHKVEADVTKITDVTKVTKSNHRLDKSRLEEIREEKNKKSLGASQQTAIPLDLQSPIPMISREKAEEAIAAGSGGRYLVGGRTTGGTFQLDKVRKQYPDGKIFSRVGAWLEAGGDAFKGKLDGRSLSNLPGWITQAQAWQGGPIVNGNGKGKVEHQRVPDADETQDMLRKKRENTE